MTQSPPTSPVTGFSHVQLLCTDVPKSERWYTTVLSAERMTAADDDSYVALRANRIVLVLSERPAGTPASGPLDHLAIAVPDGAGGFLADFTDQAAAALAEFAAAGMHVVRSTDAPASWPDFPR